MNNTTIAIIITVAIIAILIAVYLLRETEHFDQSSPQYSLATSIASFITPSTSYKEYLDFLVNHKNTSYKLLSQDTFFTLKVMSKTKPLAPSEVMGYF
jgi:hypothetical protein